MQCSKNLENMASTGIRIDELLCGERSKVMEALKNKDLYMVPEGKTLTYIYDRELSHIAIADGEFKAALLAKKVTDIKGEELIELSVAICKTGCEMWMMKLLSGFLANMRNNYPNHSIRIYGVNEEAMNLMQKFFGGQAIRTAGYSAIWMEI